MGLQHIPLGYYIFAAVLNFLSCFFLALFVFVKNPRSNINRVFSAFCFSIAQWSLFYLLWLSTREIGLADFYIRTCMIGVIFMPAIFTHFVVIFTGIQKNRTLIFLNYLISFLLSAMVYSPLYAKTGGSFQVFLYWPLPGILFPIHLTHFFANLVYSYYLILKTLRKKRGIFREQVRYVLLGTGIGFLGGVTNYFYWYRIDIPPFLNICASIGVPIITYGILRYRLMNVKIALTRAGIFIFVYTLVLGIPFLLVRLGRPWLLDVFGSGWYWLPLVLLGSLATAGPFTYIFLSAKAEARLQAEERHAHELLKQASEGVMRIRNLRELVGLISHITSKTLKLENVAVSLVDEASGNFNLASVRFRSKYHYLEKLDSSDPLVQKLSTMREPLVYDEVKINAQEQSHNPNDPIHEIESQMRKLSAAVIVPAISRGRLLGFLVLGEKKSRRVYSQEDLATLWALSYQAALAIENAFLYEKEKMHLAEQSRRQALADMAPGASHQFNNRIATISAAADILLDLVKNDSQDFSKEQLRDTLSEEIEIIRGEAVKASQITEAILQKAKVKLEFDKVDIIKVIQNAINLIRLRRTRESLAGAKDPEFSFNYPKDLPLLTLCEGTIQDVFENMFNNAYDAIVIRDKRKIEPLPYQGRIAINVSRKDNSLIIVVEDNGIGIQKENLRKLFTDLFTTKATAEKGVVGGSGLGLGVMRSFVENHGGTITVDSEYTKWTRFTIVLPIDFKPPK